MDNVLEKSIEEQIKEFKEYHGDKSFHISGGGTEYPGTTQEKHIQRKIIKGPIRWIRCKVCNEPLEELKKDDPKRRLLKYCSDECSREAYLDRHRRNQKLYNMSEAGRESHRERQKTYRLRQRIRD